MSIEYLKVRHEDVKKVGGDAAYLLAFLRLQHKTLRRDQDGYFSMDAAYVVRVLEVTRREFRYQMDKLTEAGLVERVEGKNQNVKPRYKLL